MDTLLFFDQEHADAATRHDVPTIAAYGMDMFSPCFKI
jgi:hypothetical protein